MFEGVLTALVTPFRDGEVDEPALRGLVERQISAGVDGLVPCGSTGESATLSHPEHCRVVEIVVPANGVLPHDVWTNSNGLPRIMQPVGDTDFEVEAKFDSTLPAGYFRSQGILVEENELNVVRAAST